MILLRKKILLITLCLFTLLTMVAQSLESRLDLLLSEKYVAEQPGATALVAKDRKVIYRKAFGMANLELNVKMVPENVFEIGSITKQFTAVAILMLMEQGKLSLDDEITRYLADYPTHGHKITIHHLLTHTSGIRSYTDMANFRKEARTDMTPLELIDVFKNEPMDFNPGTTWHYNNSGYILLGYIIEEVSGKSYASFVQENIFDTLGMTHSYYGNKSDLIPNRASGYQPNEDGFQNADYLSMTLPYAAGSLMSTVDDLLIWSQAIHNNTLISAASKAKAFTNYKLNNGDPTNYGYGWQPNEISDIPSIEHGGGIFGYTTMGVYIPSENVYVAVLTNSSGNSPTDVALKMAAEVIGKPMVDPVPVEVSLTDLQKWVGTYAYEDGVLRFITEKEGSLFSQREGSTVLKLIPTSKNTFSFEESSTKYIFSEENGKKAVIMKDRISIDKGVESDKLPASEKKSISLDNATLKQYIGRFELQSDFILEVTVEENQIYLQATGQPQFELFAEKLDTFFLKVVPATIDFNRNENGLITSLTLHQGGQEMQAKKLN